MYKKGGFWQKKSGFSVFLHFHFVAKNKKMRYNDSNLKYPLANMLCNLTVNKGIWREIHFSAGTFLGSMEVTIYET